MVTRRRKLISTIVGASTLMLLGAGKAQAASSTLVPEVCTTVWLENGKECASVSINGNDVVTYRSSQGNCDAESKAEELSRKLQELLRNKGFNADEILPAAEGKIASIQVGDKTLLKFEAPQDKSDASKSTIEPCLKVVNAIREASGEQKLPKSFITIASAFTGGDAFSKIKAKSCFSGKASWYGKKFHGRRAANGERYNMHKMTAAHKKLPFGTKLLVKNRKTGKTCIVRINDRGPYHGNRVIDLSMGAAKKLNMLSQGVAMVDVIVLGM